MMLNPQAGKAVFQVALFITLTSAVLLFIVKPGTAEFIVTVLSLITGLIFLGAVIMVIRRSNR